jgi:hypothetical protein
MVNNRQKAASMSTHWAVCGVTQLPSVVEQFSLNVVLRSVMCLVSGLDGCVIGFVYGQ